ncbi:MAG: response regulator, partial [Candidatus Omnitrophica bacterium]|nr:response regulator [Candidatus Omnitrophota bacterium]
MTEKILVVDDDTSILEGFSEILVENGFAVDKAQDEKEALRSFDARNYNVAIVDISLKETNGLELI